MCFSSYQSSDRPHRYTRSRGAAPTTMLQGYTLLVVPELASTSTQQPPTEHRCSISWASSRVANGVSPWSLRNTYHLSGNGNTCQSEDQCVISELLFILFLFARIEVLSAILFTFCTVFPFVAFAGDKCKERCNCKRAENDSFHVRHLHNP